MFVFLFHALPPLTCSDSELILKQLSVRYWSDLGCMLANGFHPVVKWFGQRQVHGYISVTVLVTFSVSDNNYIY